ncbi:carbohydrate ABC transporter permease [Clostridium sp. C8-1-8]|jgi:arabinosaccharide transport system permease protein|uniref:carbohydrate ABC transporter permease n=1 Tax=Clostridium sp. C8-1-8 TaxID=2698831 RepID=UPI001371AA2D|nr:carbohydrate ABC transporter permease [Clostridium sp. C8-1-8]
MSNNTKKLSLKAITLIFFTIVGLIILIPFYVIFISSFKDGGDLVRYGVNLAIDFSKMSLKNFIYLFTGDHAYFTWFFNSMLLTIVQVICTLFVSAFCAYGFAAYDFKGKNILFICVLLVMMVPFEILMLPLYNQINNMNLTDSYIAIIFPTVAHASTIFFFRQYISGIPKAIINAGRIDGASEYGIFFKLILPIMKPAFAAMAILNTMNSWNNFLWPLLVLRSDTKFTLPMGLNTLLTPYGNNYDLLIVGSFFSILPIFILFMSCQKFFIEGMTAGAVKG